MIHRGFAVLAIACVFAVLGCTSLPPPVADTKQDLPLHEPQITWQPVAGASTYVVQVSRLADFNAPGAIAFERGGLADTKLTLSSNEVTLRVTHYWRVAGEQNGSRGKWSDARPFRITIPAPSSEDKLETNNPDVTLQWEPVPGAVSYVIQIARDQAFNSIIIKKEGISDTKYRIEERFDYNKVLYWRIASMAAGDIQGEWSKTRTFKSSLPPPKLVEPSGVIYDQTRPNFRWQRPAFEGNMFQLQLSTDPKWDTIDREFTTNRDATECGSGEPALAYKANYLWRMRTLRGNAFSPWSDPSSFHIEYFLPTCLSPAKNEVVKSFNPRFQWSASQYPDGYEVEVYAVDGKASGYRKLLDPVLATKKNRPVERDRDGKTERDNSEYLTLTGENLSPETTYGWRVRSLYVRERSANPDWSRAQRSEWSAEATFRIPAEIADAFPTSLVEKTTSMNEVEPTISPDGKLLAYTAYSSGKSGEDTLTIWLKRIVMEGGRPVFQEAKQQFTPTQPKVKTMNPCWLPDSSGLYYASNIYGQEKGEFSILQKLIDRDQFTTVLQASPKQSLAQPHFNANTPKGPLLCYTTTQLDDLNRPTQQSVWTCTPTGLAKTQLTGGEGGRISPDGKRLVFNAEREDRWGIFTLGIDGGQITTLRSADRREVKFFQAAWSNDGTKIAFTSNQSGSEQQGNWDIYIYDIETGSQTQVTSSLGADIMPCWGPDDAYLIFASFRDGNWDLWYTMIPKKR